VIVLSSRDPVTLANSWLVAFGGGGPALVIDPGAPPAALLDAVARERLRPAAVLVTHRHGDHVAHLSAWTERYAVDVVAHETEAAHVAGVTRVVSHGEQLRFGPFALRVSHVPGHTAGHAAFAVEGVGTFTGDTLFRGSVGSTVGPGHSTLEDLRRSVLDVLLGLPDETTVYPGHMDPTTIGRERAENPFVHAWLGLDPVVPRPCVALGRPATMLLRATDYDGGSKCWVRFDDGVEAIVPGSRVAPRAESSK
jgi:glyoxylase-like metal-dependent hydrolase (beta-lactamase superfamily II)